VTVKAKRNIKRHQFLRDVRTNLKLNLCEKFTKAQVDSYGTAVKFSEPMTFINSVKFIALIRMKI
jgi:hypothetical protein